MHAANKMLIEQNKAKNKANKRQSQMMITCYFNMCAFPDVHTEILHISCVSFYRGNLRFL